MSLGNYVSSKAGGSVQTSVGKGGQDSKLASVAFVFTEPDDLVEKLADADKIFEEVENATDYFEKDGLYYGAIRYRTPEQAETKDEDLKVAFPLDRYNFTLPVRGEVVSIDVINGKPFYKAISFQTSVGFNTNLDVLLNTVKTIEENSNTAGLATFKEVQATGIANSNEPNVTQTTVNKGFAGKYYKRNVRLHQLKPNEGDTLIQGKAGNSIRFSGYIHSDRTDGKQYPAILIRNGENAESQINNKVFDTTTEDVNKDGTSIQITSGEYISLFKETVEVEKEAVGKYPSSDELKGDQIVVNSGRVIVSAKTSELFLFSKKNLSIFTDDIVTIDADRGLNFIVQNGPIQIATSGNNNIIIGVENGKIFAGKDGAEEPMLLGNVMVDLMSRLIDAINQMKIATPSGPSAPGPIDKVPFNNIRNELKNALSKTNYLI
jgi:hypothetical protein